MKAEQAIVLILASRIIIIQNVFLSLKSCIWTGTPLKLILVLKLFGLCNLFFHEILFFDLSPFFAFFYKPRNAFLI